MPTAFPYNYAAATVGAGSFGTFDFPANVAHLITSGPILHEFTALGRVETAIINLTTLPLFPITVLGAICSKSGAIYFATGDGHHLIVRYEPATGNETFYNDTAAGLPQAGYIAPFTNGSTYIVAAANSSGSVGSAIYVIDMLLLVFQQAFFVAEHGVSIQPGNAKVCQGFNFGIVVALSTTLNDFIGVYTVLPTTKTRQGQFSSVAVDGSAAFTGFGVPCYDATDGNLLICVGTATAFYLLKVNLATCVIMWKLVINSIVDLGECEVSHGQLQFVGAGTTPWSWYQVDTIAGTMTTTLETVLANFNNQGVWSDTKKLLISQQNNSPGFFNWATFGPPPVPPTHQGGVIRIGC